MNDDKDIDGAGIIIGVALGLLPAVTDKWEGAR
jgi:hypothetical protein